eukprot:505497-Rhodomonas_salina.1
MKEKQGGQAHHHGFSDRHLSRISRASCQFFHPNGARSPPSSSWTCCALPPKRTGSWRPAAQTNASFTSKSGSPALVLPAAC